MPGTGGFLYGSIFITLSWMPHILKISRGFEENRKVPASIYSYIMNWFQIIFHEIVYHLAKFGSEIFVKVYFIAMIRGI